MTLEIRQNYANDKRSKRLISKTKRVSWKSKSRFIA